MSVVNVFDAASGVDFVVRVVNFVGAVVVELD